MKIIVNGLDLNDALSKVSKALPVKEVVPILENIKIVAQNDKMTLIATDKDLVIENTIDANVIVSGEFLVHGKTFGEYIRSKENENEIAIEVDEDENKLNISSDGSECNLNCGNVEDYPVLEETGGDKYFVVTERNLKDIISKVLFSVATDDTRPVLKGVYLEAEEEKLTAVATDGYRFAMCKKALKEKSEYLTATVPYRSMNELMKLLGDSEDIIKVYIDGNYMKIALEGTVLMTRLLSNQYIKYNNLIPNEFLTHLVVNKESFVKSLNTASIMSRGERNNLVVLDIEEYMMKISSTSEYGTARESVSISLEGQDIRCSYNARYLNDCLKELKAESINMDFAKHNSCVITVNGSDEVLYFILPVKPIG